MGCCQSTAWTAEQLPDLTGKTALVTGGNTGIGFEVASALAAHGATVLLASRSKERVDAAVKKIKAAHPSATVVGYALDLFQFSSIDAFVDQLAVAGVSALHILINNAGVLNPPFAKTEQGFEVTMGTNAVGTIYLTQRLLPLLEAGAPSRVVVLSSELASISPALDLGDLGGEALKSTTLAQYNASKLCNALYALELSRLYGSRGVLAASTHPGIVATTLVGKADSGCFESGFLSCGLLFACTPAEGAISTLYAATVPGLKGGEGFGPITLNKGFTRPWKPDHRGYTAKNAEAMLDAALQLIKDKGGKL